MGRLSFAWLKNPIKRQNGGRPYFGWNWKGHQAIERAGIGALPDKPFRTYLETHLEAVNDASAEQDRSRRGPAHFINLEDIWHGSPLSPDQLERFETVGKAFPAGGKNLKEAAFRSHPLQIALFRHSENVIAETGRRYREIVALLKKAGTSGLSRSQREKIFGRLIEGVGALAHYAGDLHHPLHATAYHTWPLAHPGQGGAHRHTENRLMSKEDYHRWQLGFAALKTNPETLPWSRLANRTLRAAEQSYLQVFDLVAADRALRQRRLAVASYFTALKNAWQPVMEKRMTDASRFLATLLTSAYQAAGKPDLGKLETDPFRMRSRFPFGDGPAEEAV